jgi:hypothetical protein
MGVHCRVMRSSRAGLFFPPAAGTHDRLRPARLGTGDRLRREHGVRPRLPPRRLGADVVNLKSSINEGAEYLIQVVQPDMDGDTVLYSRLVTLSPNDQAKYWVYFRPQPSGSTRRTSPSCRRCSRCAC